MDAARVVSRVTKPKHRVRLGAGRVLHCESGQDVLNAAIRAGVTWLAVGCRGGGCGVCRVVVRSGTFDAGRMSARHVAAGPDDSVFALACKLYPTSDLELEYAPVQRPPA
jgi:ferredoxin